VTEQNTASVYKLYRSRILLTMARIHNTLPKLRIALRVDGLWKECDEEVLEFVDKSL
jgi:hypothetical protein